MQEGQLASISCEESRHMTDLEIKLYFYKAYSCDGCILSDVGQELAGGPGPESGAEQCHIQMSDSH